MQGEDPSSCRLLPFQIEKAIHVVINLGTQGSYWIKVANRSIENVVELKYFGMTVTNQHFI
jgi:hypothetical protein